MLQAKSGPERISESYKYHESIWKNKYEQRITEVKNEIFCPLTFACTGGDGSSASKALKQLTSKLRALKRGLVRWYDITLRTKISFKLLRSSIFCIRGSRTLSWHKIVNVSTGAVIEEGRLFVWLIYFPH